MQGFKFKPCGPKNVIWERDPTKGG